MNSTPSERDGDNATGTFSAHDGTAGTHAGSVDIAEPAVQADGPDSTGPAPVVTGRPRSEVRLDIQALRALAVGLVVLFHLWPQRLSGGYVGVDVFFVISGFLITAHLLREADRTGKISLPRFWARRARRLLPASLLVLAVTAAATWFWVPTSQWPQYFREIGASALYVQNWVLSIDAVDYLAANNEPSPAQHFWSLSLEEQFYLVWPLLMLAAVFAARKFGRNRHLWVGATLSLVALASFVLSITWTISNQASAYFVTPTRVWEFAAGGLVAVFWPAPAKNLPAVRSVVAWLGLAAIVVTGFLYTDQTPFPGYTALLPVAGTLAVLWAGTAGRVWSPGIIGDRKPIQFLGDISYSVYLWHWPMIVILPYVLGHELGKGWKSAIIVATLVVAWLTKIFVEDPVRRGRVATVKPRWVLVAAAAGMAIVTVVSSLGTTRAEDLAVQGNKDAVALAKANTPCFGAAASDPANQPCINPDLDGKIVPSPVAALTDAGGNSYNCYTGGGSAKLDVCTLPGTTDKPVKRIALVGDSHAAMFRPALEKLLKRQNWSVDLYLKQACPWTAAPVVRLDVPKNWPSLCASYRDTIQKLLEDPKGPKYDLIVVNAARTDLVQLEAGQTEKDVEVAGYVKAWKPVLDAGTPIMVIVDNPVMPLDYMKCVERTSPKDIARCGVSRAEGLGNPDTQQLAAEQLKGVSVYDMTDFYCSTDFCRTVIGGVIVYRDEHHITGTWSRTLTPFLEQALQKELSATDK